MGADVRAQDKDTGTMLGRLIQFVKEERGLVTVEWVALAAAMVVGAVSIGWLVMVNLKTPANSIGTRITTVATTPITQPHP
jgi:Flp pilus assembly pilin Flp